MSGSDFEQKPGESRRTSSGLTDSLHHGDVSSEESSSTDSNSTTTSANTTLNAIQSNMGNAILQGALMGDVLGGFGLPIAAELGGSLAGIGVPDSDLSSNTAMLKAMRDARIDWSRSSLNNLGQEGGGKSIPQDQLQRFNEAFGHDFSHVRLHTDSKAAQAADALYAHAFALGADIYFGPGEYNIGSAATDRLLAHELTHVLQHDEGRLPNKTDDGGVSNPSDPSEQEAYSNEDRILGKLRNVDASASEGESTQEASTANTTAAQPSGYQEKSESTLDSADSAQSLAGASEALESGGKTYGPAIEAARANAAPSHFAMRAGGGPVQWLWDTLKGLLFSEGNAGDSFAELAAKARAEKKEDAGKLDSEQQRIQMFQEQFAKNPTVLRLLHGTSQTQSDKDNIAILRANFAKHPFEYTMLVTGLEGVLAGNGDCRSLAVAFQRIAEEGLGIKGIEIRGHKDPFLAAGGPTLDPKMVGNANEGNQWFFQNHWWAEFQGTPIDLLFPNRAPDESSWTKAEAHGYLTKKGQKTDYEYWKMANGQTVWGNATEPVGPNKYQTGKLPAGMQVPGKHETIYRKEAAAGSGLAPGQNVINLIERSSGTPIPEAVANRMSAALGYDVSGARVHTDSAAGAAANQLNALAFALGADIYFAEGRFSPGSAQGDELIAHELAHVVQHTEGRLPSPTSGLQTSKAGDSAELEADSMARAAMDNLASPSADSVADSSVALEAAPESSLAIETSLDTTGIESSTSLETPSIDSSAVSIESAPAMRDAVDDAVGALPEDIRLSLAGMGIQVDLPSDVEVDKTIALQVNTPLFSAIELRTARVSFDEAYEFKGGAIVADIGLGEFISINETSMTVSSSGNISTSIKGAALHLSSVMATEINLSVGTEGISGDATVGFEEITLQEGFVLNEGQVRIEAHPDGSITGSGQLLGEIAGIGVFLLEAQFDNDTITGKVTVELESMELGTWGKLNSGVFEGEYTTEGMSVNGKVNMSIKDWAEAEIDLTYVHPKDGSAEGGAASAQGGGESAAESAAQTAANTDSNGAAQGSSEVAPPESQESTQSSGLEGGEQGADSGAEQGSGAAIVLPGPGTWNGSVKLTQSKELTLGEATISGGELNFNIEDNIVSTVDYNANIAIPHFSGNANGTYDIVNDKLSGTGTLTLTESITLESGVVITACSGEMTLVDNEVTTIKGSFEAQVPYESEPTFKVNADDLVYDVKEEKFGGTVTVTTMRDLSFGPTDGTRAVITAESSAEAIVEENSLKKISGEIAYKVIDPVGDLGSGTLTMEFNEEGVNANGNFTLDTQYGMPSREVGPAFIEPGAELSIELVAGQLTKADIKNVTFSINNPAGEGQGRVLGMAEGSYDFQTGEVSVTIMAGIVENWPFTSEWGTITFTSGGSVTASIEKNDLDIFEVHVPFEASFNTGPGIKIVGEVNGSYDSETQKYSGSISSTLAENVDIVFTAGDKVTLVAGDTTATAEVAENALDEVTMGISAQYYDKDGTNLLDGTVTDASYMVKESKLSFTSELTLQQPIEKQTEDGKWKLVVLDGRTVNVEVVDNQLVKIGGSVDFEVWDEGGKLLNGSINEASVDTINWTFSGEMDLKTARDFVHPRSGDDLGIGPEWQFVVKTESGVHGRIEDNKLANLGAELLFDINREGAPFANGSLSGDLDMQSDEFTGKGKVALSNDFALEPTDKSGKLGGWALIIAQGSGVDVDINKNDLIKTTINLEGRVDVDGTTYAVATVNGSYKIGDPDGYTGSVGVEVTNDIIWNQDSRFEYLLAATSSIKAETVGSKVTSAEGTFLLAASEAGVTKVIATLDTNWTESGGLNASGEIDVEEDIQVYSKNEWALFLEKDSGGTGTIASDELTEIGGTINLRLDKDGTPVVGGSFGATYSVAEGANASIDATGTITLLNPLDLGTVGDWGFELNSATAEGKITASELDYVDGSLGVTISYKGAEVALAELTGRYTHGDKPDFSGTGTITLYEPIDTGVKHKDYSLILDPGASINVEIAEFALKTLSVAVPTRIVDNDGDLLGVTLNGTYSHPDKTFDGTGEITLLRQVQVAEFGENYGIFLETDTSATIEVVGNDFKEMRGQLSASLHDGDGEFLRAKAEGSYTKSDEGDKINAAGGITVTREKRLDSGNSEYGFSVLPCSGVQAEVADNELLHITGSATAGIYKGSDQVAEAAANVTYQHKPESSLDVNGGITVLKDIDTGVKYNEFNLVLAEGSGATVDVLNYDLKTLSATVSMRIDEGTNPLVKIDLGGTYDHAKKDFTGSGKAELLRQVCVARNVGPKGYSFFLEPVSGMSADVQNNKLTKAEGTLAASVHDAKGQFLTVGAKGTYSKQDDGDKLSIEGAMLVTRETHMLDAAGYGLYLIPGESGGLVTITDNDLTKLGGTISMRVDKDGKKFAAINLAGVYTPDAGFAGKGTAELLSEIEVGEMGEYKLFIEPGTGAEIKIESNEPTHVSGTVKIRIDEGSKKFIKGEVTIDYDVKSNAVKLATGSAEVLIEKELGAINEEKLFLCPGTGATVEISNGNLTKLGGSLILSMRDTSEYLNIKLAGSFDAAGGTGFTGTGEAKVTKDKKLFGDEGAYSFWLAGGEASGAIAHIDKNDLTKVTGNVPFLVKDGQPEPLIRGQANGSYDAKTGLFDGSGEVYLGRDIEFTMGNGSLIKFKAGSGGGGEVVKSELRKLTGTLNCEIHDSDGLMVTLSASGEFDAVKKELVWVEGSATFERSIEPLGAGILIIDGLTGSARMEKGKLVWAKAKGNISIPPLKDATGTFELNWRNDGSKDYYSGKGKLNVDLIEDNGSGRKLGGQVDFEYREDDTYKVGGKLDFTLNEKIGGEVTIEMEGGKGQAFDPVIGANINYRQELMPEKELFQMKMDLLPAQSVQLGYGFVMNFGAEAGMGLNLRPLMAEANIGFENWRPLSEGSTPTFTAGLTLDWGVDFEMFVAAYLSLGWVAAGGGVRGEAKLDIAIPVTASGELTGGPDGFDATLDFGVSIVPSVTLSATPYVYAGLDGIASWNKDLATFEYNLGDLFEWNWNKRYHFGDTDESEEGAAGANASAPAAESSDAAQEEAPSLDPPSSAPAGGEVGAPQMESGQEMGEQSGMGSGQGGGEMSDMEQKMQAVEKIGKGIGALAYLLGLLVKLITALATAGPIGLMLMFVWEICFGDLSWTKLVESVTAVIDMFTDSVVLSYLEDLKPQWWKTLEGFMGEGKPGLADALFGADDKMREAVNNDEHREADTNMRGKMMEAMMDGICGDADEDCILIVLRFSEGKDLSSVVSAGGGAQRMWEKLDGRQNDELEAIFDRNGIHYSSGVGAHIASLW